MTEVSVKKILRKIYNSSFGILLAEKEKEVLRYKVLTLPITGEYPFDVEVKMLRSLGINTSMMFDIGANTGLYSAVMEDLVGPSNLYIFEPLPELYQYLKNRFRKAHVFNFALSEREGTQPIRVPFVDGERFATRATLNEHIEPHQTGFEEIDVQLVTLDSVVRRLQPESIGFIKIDVEGHELAVIKGGIDTITRFMPLLLVEIESRHHQCSISSIFSEIEDLGYKGYYINPECFELFKTEQFKADRDQNQEYLITRNFFRYINNFFFVTESSEKSFVSKAMTFLASEKSLARKASEGT